MRPREERLRKLEIDEAPQFSCSKSINAPQGWLLAAHWLLTADTRVLPRSILYLCLGVACQSVASCLRPSRQILLVSKATTLGQALSPVPLAVASSFSHLWLAH
ncbi:hypothetical protein RRG08_051970 [Elysia crispata]|uniref:Uncharacterized protein n=1 Tax=Elysia crispata TaxID=231223 RepID=A0AAE0ZCT2_9GAST|nr:hypothetical protein RRG08_051970 [Elysia crispata]